MRRAVCPALVLALAGCATVAPPRVSQTGQAPRPPGPAREGNARSEPPPPQAARDRETRGEPGARKTEGEPPRRSRSDDELAAFEFQARLAVRARSYLGRRGPFHAKGQRFSNDCSGFVEAVYAAEGLLLRDLVRRVAPGERGGAAGEWQAVRASGRTFDLREWPAPGDLVFWDNTYDRNRNGRADDRLSHVGIVEYVENGTVFFIHRGSRGVARGVMTPARPDEASDADGRKLNSSLRSLAHPARGAPVLAGELFAGYGRIDPGRVPPEYATGRIDPFFGPASDRDPPAGDAAAPHSTSSPTSKRTRARSVAATKKKSPVAKGSAKERDLAPAKEAVANRTAAPRSAPGEAGQRAEIAGPGADSAPSSETRTAAARKSSIESLRTTGITDPAGSR